MKFMKPTASNQAMEPTRLLNRILLLVLFALLCTVLGGCAMVHDIFNPMTLDEWIDSEDGQGGGSR